MQKPYINNAVVGNSKMLGCLTDKGELIRLYWPNIDFPQHLDRMLVGIFDIRYKNSTRWTHEGNKSFRQAYVGNTNILETEITDYERNLFIKQTDFCVCDQDILIRQFSIKNNGGSDFQAGLVLVSQFMSTNQDMSNTMFDFYSDSLIHYRYNYYFSINSEYEASQFQLGNNPFGAGWYGELVGNDSIGMVPDGGMAWKIGTIQPGQSATICIRMCFSNTLKGVKELAKKTRLMQYSYYYEKTFDYWREYLRKLKQPNTSNELLRNLYSRSLLVFKLMSDGSTGGLLAAPEVDENFTKCGRYAYCWGRDAAFITEAMDSAGMYREVENFYDWAVKVQDAEGYWHQRYNVNGNVEPSWGIQIDETGTIIWGILSHYRYTSNMAFLERMWTTIEKAVNFLTSFLDKETGLPNPSYDLWEERYGEHTYSAAAVYGGITAGVQIGRLLGKNEQMLVNWDGYARTIKVSIDTRLWNSEKECFLRSVKTKLNPWGVENSSKAKIITVNPKG